MLLQNNARKRLADSSMGQLEIQRIQWEGLSTRQKDGPK